MGRHNHFTYQKKRLFILKNMSVLVKGHFQVSNSDDRLYILSSLTLTLFSNITFYMTCGLMSDCITDFLSTIELT